MGLITAINNFFAKIEDDAKKAAIEAKAREIVKEKRKLEAISKKETKINLESEIKPQKEKTNQEITIIQNNNFEIEKEPTELEIELKLAKPKTKPVYGKIGFMDREPTQKKPEPPKQSKNLTIDLLKQIEWLRFEELCIEYLKVKGRNARGTGRGADDGIDIKVFKDSKIVAIGQCKAWSWKIKVNPIRELYGTMASEEVENGIFFTTSEFTADAYQFSKNKQLTLIDGKTLIRKINALTPEEKEKLYQVATLGDYKTPTCPNCYQKMIKRTTKRGKNQGSQFWGCKHYPRCKNTIRIKQSELSLY